MSLLSLSSVDHHQMYHSILLFPHNFLFFILISIPSLPLSSPSFHLPRFPPSPILPRTAALPSPSPGDSSPCSAYMLDERPQAAPPLARHALRPYHMLLLRPSPQNLRQNVVSICYEINSSFLRLSGKRQSVARRMVQSLDIADF